MNNIKQTAVEWLLQQLYKEGLFKTSVSFPDVAQLECVAKAMEIEQKIEFAEEYEQYAYNASSNNRYVSPITAKQYHKLKYEIDAPL